MLQAVYVFTFHKKGNGNNTLSCRVKTFIYTSSDVNTGVLNPEILQEKEKKRKKGQKEKRKQKKQLGNVKNIEKRQDINNQGESYMQTNQ